jgi:uncharacterized membrane protein
LDLDWRSRAFIALSVMGIAVAVYHGYGELTYTLGACSINHTFSCESVFASGYTTFPPAGSIPGLGKSIEFWVYGVVWFPFVLAAGVWVILKRGLPDRSILVPLLMVGDLFTLYPWDIEIRLLGGVYCLVCVSLYCINYALTLIALFSKAGVAKGAAPETVDSQPPGGLTRETEGWSGGKSRT